MKQTVSDYLQIGISLGPSDCTYSILADQVSDLLHRAVWDSIRDVTITWPQFRVLVQSIVKESIQSK